MLHPHPETTSSVMINSNCPRLVMEFGDVSVHFNSPVWLLAYKRPEQSSCEMWTAYLHLWYCALWLWSVESWTHTWNTALQLGLCTLYLSKQSCWAPCIPMAIRPTSGMRVKGKKKRCKLVPVHALKAYCGSIGTATSILNLDTRWRSVVNFMSPAALPPG